MEEEIKTVSFMTEDGPVELYILEETVIQGVQYILVTDELDDDSEESFVSILKETKNDENDEYIQYEAIEDEEEMTAVAKVFKELMDDVDFEI